MQLGQVIGTAFNAGQAPAAANERGAYVRLTGTLTSPWYGGGVIGPFTVTASAAAVYVSANEVRTVMVTSFSCR